MLISTLNNQIALRCVQSLYDMEVHPLAWRGQFTRGDYGVPTMVLEAVASRTFIFGMLSLKLPGQTTILMCSTSPTIF
jgi:hypothetical protein